jgi:hypothetical protein
MQPYEYYTPGFEPGFAAGPDGADADRAAAVPPEPGRLAHPLSHHPDGGSNWEHAWIDLGGEG